MYCKVSAFCKVDLEDLRKSGQWGHILKSSDGIKDGEVFFEVGCKLMGIHIEPYWICSKPPEMMS